MSPAETFIERRVSAKRLADMGRITPKQYAAKLARIAKDEEEFLVSEIERAVNRWLAFRGVLRARVGSPLRRRLQASLDLLNAQDAML